MEGGREDTAIEHSCCEIPVDQKKLNLRRAARLAQEGAYRKATTALTSDGIAAMTEEVKKAFLAKHPQVPHSLDNAHLLFEHELSPSHTHKPITAAEIRIAVDRTPPASAAGGTGLSFTHLQDMLRVPTTDDRKGLAPDLATLASRAAKGKLPPIVAAWFSGAPLTALRKRDAGIRPIAVGETLRRLVGKVLMTRSKAEAVQLLAPSQLGVSVRGGAEVVVHTVHHLFREFGHENELGLLQLDFENAFNLVNRQAVLRAVRKHFPELTAYVEMIYGNTETPYLWSGPFRLRSVAGVQQGDPLGSLLLCLVLHDLMSMMPPAPVGPDGEPAFKALMFYADDGVVVGTHAALQHLLDFFSSERARAHGIHLRTDKCSLWWPSTPAPATLAKYPPTLQTDFSGGCIVLQAPVGDEAFMEATMFEHVRGLKSLLAALKEMEEGHVAFSLLRSCMGTSRLNHPLRVVPPSCTALAAQAFDKATGETLRDLMGGVLPTDTLDELRFPVLSKSPSFGFGLTSAAAIRHAAHLASVSLCLPMMGRITGGSSRPSQLVLASHPTALASHAAWEQQVDLEDRIDITDASTESLITQRELVKKVHKTGIAKLPRGDNRTAAFRKSLGLPGAKDWLSCNPSPRLCTFIADRDFWQWFRFHCRVPLLDIHAVCPRKG